MTALPHERAVEEFWVHVVGRKWIVLGIVAVSNLLGFFLYTLATPVYESRIGIDVRKTFIDNRLQKIQPGKDVKRYLEAEFENSGHDDGKIRVYKPIVIEQPKRDLVYFLVRGSDPDEMTKFVSEPLNELLSRHKQTYTAGRQALDEAIEDIQTRLDRLGVQEGSLTDAGPPPHPIHSQRSGAAGQDAAQGVENGVELEGRLYKLRKIAGWIKPTRVLKSAYLSNQQVSPVLMVYLLLASMVGITFGLICAILLARRDEHGAW